jgi:phage-related baseplate assembly protein
MIDYKTSDIINLYKSAYFDQTGKTLQIGSNDFAVASVHAYILAILSGAFNRESMNSFIDSATGEYLDAIAATFGLSRPNGTKATLRVRFTYKSHAGQTPSFIPVGDVKVSLNGYTFQNDYELDIYSGGVVHREQTLYAEKPGSEYNGIPETAEFDIISGDYWIAVCEPLSMTGGGTDGFEYTEAGDNAFRAWLKTEIKTLAGAGTYLAYEAKARNADPRILDAHVLKQGETGYQKGKVKIFVYTKDTTGGAISRVQSECNSPSFRPIGDLVEVVESPLDAKEISKVLRVTYLPQFSGDAQGRTDRIISEYLASLKEKIGKPFIAEELCRLLVLEDEQGVYATDALFLGILSDTLTVSPLYPAPGYRLNITSIPHSIQIVG